MSNEVNLLTIGILNCMKFSMISQAYAQQNTPAAAQNPITGFGATLFPMAVVMLIFYFLLIRPQKKRDQLLKSFHENLKRGDEVVTQSGLLGRIAGVEGNVVLLEIAQNVKVRVSKASVVGLQVEPQAVAQK